MNKAAKTTWDCRQAKAEIALKAGGDAVDPSQSGVLESHLAECSACRNYLADMAASLESLQVCATEFPPPIKMRSLWPQIASQLPPTRLRRVTTRFNLWVPTAAMAAACAAMILVTIVQLERVVPYRPIATPPLRNVLYKELPDVRGEDELAERRLRDSSDPTFSGSLPVHFEPRMRPGHGARDREW
jgi:anti-sigma factor RsiW